MMDYKFQDIPSRLIISTTFSAEQKGGFSEDNLFVGIPGTQGSDHILIEFPFPINQHKP